MGTATEKQLDYLKALASKKVTEPNQDERLREIFTGTRVITSRDASLFIDILKGQPWKPRENSQSLYAAAQVALADVESSFYGIPAGYVSAQGVDLKGSDHLFVRVSRYGGKVYLKRVHGGSEPWYSALPPQVAVALAPLLRERVVEFAGLWNEHSGRCGKCNAVLTDQGSRDRGLGPDCARQLGVK